MTSPSFDGEAPSAALADVDEFAETSSTLEQWRDITQSLRGLLAIATAVLITTAIQVLLNPIAVILVNGASWDSSLPIELLALILMVICACQAAALLLSNRMPLLTVGATLAAYAVAILVATDAPNWVSAMNTATAVALFLLAARARLLTTISALAGTAAVVIAIVLSLPSTSNVPPPTLAAYLLAFAAGFMAPLVGGALLGFWWGVQSRRAQRSRAAADAARREHAERVAQARHAERERIAQELHDVAGQHLMGLLSVADAASQAGPPPPDVALGIIDDVRREARFAAAAVYTAMQDLRADEGERTESTPDVGDLPDLVAFWQERQLPVSLTTHGSVEEIPPAVSTTAFRIVAESLTNAAKYAPGTDVAVTLSTAGAHLSIRVDNPQGQPADGSTAGLGWGLRGLNHRVRLLGGHFTAAPIATGGWRVEAELPLDPPPDAIRNRRVRKGGDYGSPDARARADR